MIPSLFPNDPGPRLGEQVRVLARGPETIIVRLVRTETSAAPEQWTLLTGRIPEGLVEGIVATVRFTPWELEYLQGRRELR